MNGSQFSIWRNNSYRAFLFVVCLACAGILCVGWHMSSFYRELHEGGVVVEGSVTGQKTARAIRGADNQFFFYEYTDAEGELHQGNTSMVTLQVGRPVTVTYLFDDPSRHVLHEVPEERINQPLRDAGKFVGACLLVVFGFGQATQFAMRRSARPKSPSA